MKRKLHIPKRFTLLAREICIEYDRKLFADRDCFGMARLDHDKIVLQPPDEFNCITRQGAEQIFLHEVVHFILLNATDDSDSPPLHNRECLVDRISGLLHQFLVTAEYDDDTKQIGTGE